MWDFLGTIVCEERSDAYLSLRMSHCFSRQKCQVHELFTRFQCPSEYPIPEISSNKNKLQNMNLSLVLHIRHQTPQKNFRHCHCEVDYCSSRNSTTVAIQDLPQLTRWSTGQLQGPSGYRTRATVPCALKPDGFFSGKGWKGMERAWSG